MRALGRGPANGVWLGVAALFVWSCESRPPLQPSLTVRDSAGVTVYEAPSGLDPKAWTLSDSAALLMADRDQPDGTPLYSVRAGRLFDDGSFVIVNGGSDQIRFYSAEGVLEWVVGREGDGPGEFRYVSFLQVVGDSVWVYDGNNARITVLARNGEFGRTIPIEGRALGVLGNGSVFVWRNVESSMLEPGRVLPIHHRMLLLDPATDTTVELGRFFTEFTYWHALGGDRFISSHLPFAGRGLFAFDGGRWLYSGGEAYRVEQYDAGGRLQAIFARVEDPAPVGEGDMEAYIARVVPPEAASAAFVQRMRQVPVPERMPAYAELLVDHDGDVWARPHGGEPPRRCWDVYQRDPPLLAEACLPERFTVLDIGSASILGVLRDELDVERVAIYRLSK